MTTATLERHPLDQESNPTFQDSASNQANPLLQRIWRATRVQMAGLVICLVLLCLAMKLWQANLRVPFGYFGDTVLIHMLVKGTVENGWYLHNDALGAPGRMDIHDFPMADHVHLLWIVVMRQFTRDHALIFNLFYLLTFPLTTATAIWSLRRLGVSGIWALVFGLLYAFQPYHFLRGTGHYFLSAYYLLPPMIWLIVRVYQGRGPFLSLDAESRASGAYWMIGAAILIAILTGGSGVYYAFFSCVLACVAGLSAAISLRRWTPLVNACLLSAVTTVSLAACLAPSAIYWRTHGRNPAAVDRSPAMAELFGLKMSQLVMPVPMHRISKLRHWTEYLMQAAPFTNENACSVLGVLGSIGFLWLMARLLIRGRMAVRTDPVEGLTVLNAAAVLLGTVGGFGAMLSWLGVTWIRGYNRISIVIAFFALAMLALALDRLSSRLATHRLARIGLPAVALFVLLVGMFDQAGYSACPAYKWTTNEYLHDAAYIEAFENSVPAGTMIFQMPLQQFVEHTPAPGMTCYDQMRPYLHSHHLHWSYGAVDGRPANDWQREVTKKPTHDLIAAVRAAGFSAIYVDRNGYADHGYQIEKELKAELTTTGYVSKNDRYCIYMVPKKS